MGDIDSVVASLPVTEPGWYSLTLADGTHGLTAVYDLLLTRSGGGLAVASFTYRSEGSSPIGTVSGIHVQIATDGGCGPPWGTGNLLPTVKAVIWAPYGTAPTTLDLTVTATLAPLEADAYDYDDTNDRRTSRPFRLRIERDLIPEWTGPATCGGQNNRRSLRN